MSSASVGTRPDALAYGRMLPATTAKFVAQAWPSAVVGPNTGRATRGAPPARVGEGPDERKQAKARETMPPRALVPARKPARKRSSRDPATEAQIFRKTSVVSAGLISYKRARLRPVRFPPH